MKNDVFFNEIVIPLPPNFDITHINEDGYFLKECLDNYEFANHFEKEMMTIGYKLQNVSIEYDVLRAKILYNE